ncbi:MAG: hypothetical protein FJY99_07460 [Candidatus Sericytochromatia bacterium]|nr:hypothetical protein [Candidatus Tanganyikabacteria bacterium]
MRKIRSETQKGLQTCKYCVQCSAWYPLTEFYIDRAKADGLRPYCKVCDIAKAKRAV